jgi:hypothetical protein
MVARTLTLAAGAALLLAPPAGTAPARSQTVRQVKITPEEAMRLLFQQRQYERVRKIALALLWNDIRRPEPMYYLAASCEKLGEREPAAVYCHLLGRILDDPATPPHARADWFRRFAANRLKVLDAEHRKRKAAYEAAAAGKRFTAPAQADDLWMTQVRCDLHNLHGLYAWKLVGGRKDVKAEWIHNRKGRMHRSGMKYVDEVDGRKGVLFGIPIKAGTSPDADKHHRAVLKKLGHPTRITTPNVGKCRFLRIGAKAYGFAFILKAYAGGKQVLSAKVTTKEWSDLKVDLGAAAGGDVPIIVELVVPEKQRWSEGAWIDYIDFFTH